jgi:hypothetical protein
MDAGASGAFGEAVVFGASGNALALCDQQVAPNDYRISANRYTTSSNSWEGLARIPGDAISPSMTELPTFLNLAADANSNALAVWAQWNNYSTSVVLTSRYTTGSGWGAPLQLDSNGGFAFFPQILIDANGDGFAMWYENQSGHSNVWSRRFE